MNKVMIDNENFATLCICALRYCQGRRSYMPSLVQQIVGSHLKDIPDKDLEVMLEDCEFQRSVDLYGDECDKVDWLNWESRLKEEKKARGSK